jgi:predicted RNase H-like nuclease (RuvC/YqgF family)
MPRTRPDVLSSDDTGYRNMIERTNRNLGSTVSVLLIAVGVLAGIVTGLAILELTGRL